MAELIETSAVESESIETPGYVVYDKVGGETAVLSENEYRLLEILNEKMSANDWAGAAEHINKNETQFRQLFEETLGREGCFFDGTSLKREAEGYGLALRHPTTLFYGNFTDNAPEGECVALKAMVLDYPRYDYSKGSWKNGVMEGRGRVGYHCYEGTDGTEYPEIEKTGIFKNDLMDGAVTYRTTNCDEISLVFELEASEGRTVLTDSWEFDQSHDDYRLLSKNDANRAFALKKSEMNSVRWMNMIKWKE